MVKRKVLFMAKVIFFMTIMNIVAYAEVTPSFVVKEISVGSAKIIITFNRRPGFLNQELKYKDSIVLISRTKNMFQVGLSLDIPNYISVRTIPEVDKMFFIYWHQFGEESEEVLLLKSWEGDEATFLVKRDSVNISKDGAENNSCLGDFIVNQHYMISEQD